MHFNLNALLRWMQLFQDEEGTYPKAPMKEGLTCNCPFVEELEFG
jgi:hypothetical protein